MQTQIVHLSCKVKYRVRNDRLKSLGFSDYSAYIRSSRWRRFRAVVASAELFSKCIACSTAKDIRLHHIDYSHVGDERLGDLVPVCDTCHSQIHKWEHASDETDLRDVPRQLREIFGLTAAEADRRWQPFLALRSRSEGLPAVESKPSTAIAVKKSTYTGPRCDGCSAAMPGSRKKRCKKCERRETKKKAKARKATKATKSTPTPRKQCTHCGVWVKHTELTTLDICHGCYLAKTGFSASPKKPVLHSDVKPNCCEGLKEKCTKCKWLASSRLPRLRGLAASAS